MAMDSIEDVIERLPRTARRFPNAIVWQDAAGQLNIELVANGALVLSESSDNPDLWELRVGDDD